MVIEGCAFRTERLASRSGIDAMGPALARYRLGDADAAGDRLAAAGVAGDVRPSRAARWIAERDAEATTLLVSELRSGLGGRALLLHEEARRQAQRASRSGWATCSPSTPGARGLGGELVGGFVAWCRAQPTYQRSVGGVAPGNVASIRILERHGFRQLVGQGDHDDELEYRLTLRA